MTTRRRTRLILSSSQRSKLPFAGLLVRLEVDRGVDQGLLVLALPEPRHRFPERRVGLDLVDVEAPRPRVALVPGAARLVEVEVEDRRLGCAALVVLRRQVLFLADVAVAAGARGREERCREEYTMRVIRS